jgi:uncharacterized protein (DUF302 family)
MKNLAYTVVTAKSVDEAVKAVEQNAVAHGFRVLHIHDIAATLGDDGFEHEPVKIVEVCNARYASKLLAKDITAALMVPCPIAVYQQEGQVHISTMLATAIADLFPGKSLEFVAEQVEFAVLGLVNDAARAPLAA